MTASAASETTLAVSKCTGLLELTSVRNTSLDTISDLHLSDLRPPSGSTRAALNTLTTLSALSLRSLRLRRLFDLSSLHSLRLLAVTFNRLANLTMHHDLNLLPTRSLEILDLSHNELELVEGDLFSMFFKLRELYLLANRIRHIERISLASAHLTCVDLSRNRLSGLPLLVTNSNAHLLQIDLLDMSEQREQQFSFELQRGAMSKLRIETLNLSACGLGTLNRNFSKFLQDLGNSSSDSVQVEFLDLTRNSFYFYSLCEFGISNMKAAAKSSATRVKLFPQQRAQNSDVLKCADLKTIVSVVRSDNNNKSAFDLLVPVECNDLESLHVELELDDLRSYCLSFAEFSSNASFWHLVESLAAFVEDFYWFVVYFLVLAFAALIYHRYELETSRSFLNRVDSKQLLEYYEYLKTVLEKKE